MFALLSVCLSLLSLTFIGFGVGVAITGAANLLAAIVAVAIGSVGMILAIILCIRTCECCQNKMAKEKTKSQTLSYEHEVNGPLITPDTTETLMKSIRGIPFLMQAIQYSLETTYYSTTMGGPANSSVIHTAPGCTSVLDNNVFECGCNADNSRCEISIPRGCSTARSSVNLMSKTGPEEQWEATDTNRWSNPQLKLSMNRRTSSLIVNAFPYAENRQNIDNEEPCGDAASLNASRASQLSRVTVSHATLPTHEVRCIGMSSAFMSRFNSSFKSPAMSNP